MAFRCLRFLISHSLAGLTREVLSSPIEHKIHIFSPTCNIFNEITGWCFCISSDTTYMNLSDAAKVGDLETLKTAFTRGLHVDQRDKYYKTPLMTACSHGNIDIANYLIQIG